MAPPKKRGRPRVISRLAHTERGSEALALLPTTSIMPAISTLLADAQTIAGTHLTQMKALQQSGQTAPAKDLRDIVAALQGMQALEQAIIGEDDLSKETEEVLNARLDKALTSGQAEDA